MNRTFHPDMFKTPPRPQAEPRAPKMPELPKIKANRRPPTVRAESLITPTYSIDTYKP